MLRQLLRLGESYKESSNSKFLTQGSSTENESDPLDRTLYRHRVMLLLIYLFTVAAFLALVSDTSPYAIPTVLDFLYGLVAGSSPPWAEVDAVSTLSQTGVFLQSALTEKTVFIVGYVALLGIVLSGVGTIRLDRAARTRWRTISSFTALSVIGALVILGCLSLLLVMSQSMQNDFERDPQIQPLRWLSHQSPTTIIVGAWAFWFMISLIYWLGRDSRAMLSRIVRILLATSWIEFSLALPIDIAARNRGQECYCARGSWMALVFIVPTLIFLMGPGLYLLYLRERELSSLDPTRARAILRRKSAVRRRPAKIKVETHVSNARTLSLLAIALGFVALELGIFNNQRGTLFTEARALIVIGYLKEKFSSDDQLFKAMAPMAEHPELFEAKLSRVSPDERMPFDRISVTASGPPPPTPPLLHPPPPPPPPPQLPPSAEVPSSQPQSPSAEASSSQPQSPSAEAPGRFEPTGRSILGFEISVPVEGGFKAEVTRNGQSWNMSSFSLDRTTPDRLERILEDLQVSSNESSSKLMNDIKEKLYGRHVKLPGADFWDFSTEGASWIVALFCVAVLVALRSSLRQIRKSSNAGIEEPWLILDAEVFGERAMSVAWLISLSMSGWLASFGLILSVMNGFQAANPKPNASGVGLAYLLFLLIMTAITWLALGIVADLLRIREVRRLIRQAPEIGAL